MPNLYARASHVMAAMEGATYAPSDTGLLPQYIRAIERVSREVDAWCGRHFYWQLATRYYQWWGAPRDERRRLVIGDDLLATTAVAVDQDGDAVYETALVEDTDYWLGPEERRSGWPYWEIFLRRGGSQLSAWPTGLHGERGRVEVTGRFGFSATAEATGLTGTLGASGSALTASAAADSLIDVGETLVLDSEQVYVSAVSGTTVTVSRAQNGTASAAHSAGTAILRRVYPAEVTGAVIDQVRRSRWREAQGLVDAFGGGGPVAPVPGGWAQIRDTLNHYRVLVVA